MDYLDNISKLESDFEAIANAFTDNRNDCERYDEWKAGFVGAMRGIIGVVEAAQKSEDPLLDDILVRVEAALNHFITFAYSCRTGFDTLFENLNAFCDSGDRPLLKFQRPEGHFSHKMKKAMLLFIRTFKQLKDTPPPQGPAPWKDTPHPHPLSTRCARFMDSLPDTCPPPEKPLAELIFQARAEVSSMSVNDPAQLIASPTSNCVMTLTAGGYKDRTPFVTFFVNDGRQPADRIEARAMKLGLANLASDGAIDDTSKLLFVGDSARIKSYSWWDAENDTERKELLPVHTLDSRGFEGAMSLLQNVHVVRTGKGKIGVWNLSGLPTHFPVGRTTAKPARIGKSIIKTPGDELDTWRDDSDEIELSRGSAPTSTTMLPDKDFTISQWHRHPNAQGSMIVSTDSDHNSKFYCRVLDLNGEARFTALFLGHGGEINGFSTSGGDPTVFLTACGDGYARLYDVRQPLPQITIQVGDELQNCSAAVLCHPDGIPYIFLAEEASECVTLWDVRARAPLYELATGNNCVTGLVWNESRSELYASTECQYVDHMGYHHGYIPAMIPRERHPRGEDEEMEDSEGSEDSWDAYLDTDRAWPKHAFHGETEFGHIFDSGYHRIYRYAFKSSPDMTIVPKDGGVTRERW